MMRLVKTQVMVFQLDNFLSSRINPELCYLTRKDIDYILIKNKVEPKVLSDKVSEHIVKYYNCSFPYNKTNKDINVHKLYCNFETNNSTVLKEKEVDITRYCMSKFKPCYLNKHNTENTNKSFMILSKNRDRTNMIHDLLDNYIEDVKVKSCTLNKDTGFNTSSLEIWRNESKLSEIVEKIIYDEEKEINVKEIRDYMQSNCTEGNSISPGICKSLLKGVSGKRVLCTSLGWGNWLLGILPIEKDIDFFHGVDPLSCLISRYENIVDDLSSSPDKYLFTNEPFEDIELEEDDMYDTIIFDYPAFKSENYESLTQDDESSKQSVNRYDTYESWLINFLCVSVSKAWKHLNEHGMLIVPRYDSISIKREDNGSVKIENKPISEPLCLFISGWLSSAYYKGNMVVSDGIDQDMETDRNTNVLSIWSKIPHTFDDLEGEHKKNMEALRDGQLKRANVSREILLEHYSTIAADINDNFDGSIMSKKKKAINQRADINIPTEIVFPKFYPTTVCTVKEDKEGNGCTLVYDTNINTDNIVTLDIAEDVPVVSFISNNASNLNETNRNKKKDKGIGYTNDNIQICETLETDMLEPEQITEIDIPDFMELKALNRVELTNEFLIQGFDRPKISHKKDEMIKQFRTNMTLYGKKHTFSQKLSNLIKRRGLLDIKPKLKQKTPSIATNKEDIIPLNEIMPLTRQNIVNMQDKIFAYEDSIRGETISEQGNIQDMPHESMPHESIPQESIPQEDTQESIPQENTQEESTQQEDTQESIQQEDTQESDDETEVDELYDNNYKDERVNLPGPPLTRDKYIDRQEDEQNNIEEEFEEPPINTPPQYLNLNNFINDGNSDTKSEASLKNSDEGNLFESILGKMYR